MKTKVQKQQEALERKRALYKTKVHNYLWCQYGTVGYEDLVKINGTSYADAFAEKARKTFDAYLSEARLDRHGNEL